MRPKQEEKGSDGLTGPVRRREAGLSHCPADQHSQGWMVSQKQPWNLTFRVKMMTPKSSRET